MNRQNIAILVAIGASLILLGGILYLGNIFKDMKKEGTQCITNPIEYANMKLEQRNEDIICSCNRKSMINPTVYNLNNFSVNFS